MGLSRPPAASRTVLLNAHGGLIAEPFPISTATTTAVVPTSGTAYHTMVGLAAGDQVGGVAVYKMTAYVLGIGSISLVKVALLSLNAAGTTGTVVAVSADVQAVYNGTGKTKHAFTATYPILTNGVYACAWLYVAGGVPPTTPPGPARGAGANSQANGVGSGGLIYGTTTGLTDIAVNDVLTIAGFAPCLWLSPAV